MSPEIQAQIEHFQKELGSTDELLHVLLKGHLLLEEALEGILNLSVFHREHIDDARLTFFQKFQIARSFCLRKNQFGEWDLIAAINALRNDLTHNLNSPVRDRKLTAVKDLYFREASGFSEIEEIKKCQDHEILYYACSHCAGFLATYASDLKGLRRIIYEYDRTLNPDLPTYEL